jgi:hypothetical protein
MVITWGHYRHNFTRSGWLDLKTCEMPSNLRIEIKAVFLSLAGGRARTWRIGRSGAYTLGLGVHTECLPQPPVANAEDQRFTFWINSPGFSLL